MTPREQITEWEIRKALWLQIFRDDPEGKRDIRRFDRRIRTLRKAVKHAPAVVSLATIWAALPFIFHAFGG